MTDSLVEVLLILNVFVRFFSSNSFHNSPLKYALETFFRVIEGRSPSSEATQDKKSVTYNKNSKTITSTLQ